MVCRSLTAVDSRQRGEMKAHIGNLDKEISKLAEAVLKERFVLPLP